MANEWSTVSSIPGGAEHGRVTVGLNARVRPSPSPAPRSHPVAHEPDLGWCACPSPRASRGGEPSRAAAHRGAQCDAGGRRTRRRVDLGRGGPARGLRLRVGVDQRARSNRHTAPLDHDDRAGAHRSRPPRHGMGPGSRPPGRPCAPRRRWGRDSRGGPAAAPLPGRVVGGPHRRRHRVVRAARRLALVRGTTRWTVGAAEPGGAPRGRPDGPRRGVARTRPRHSAVRPPRARGRLPHRGLATRHGNEHLVVGRSPHRLPTRAPRPRRRGAHRRLRG